MSGFPSPARGGPRTRRAAGLCAAVAVAAGVAAGPAAAAEDNPSPQRLRIVGGLGKLNQYTRHEQPFWTQELPRLTQGQATAEIVPFDQAGLRGSEMLRLMQIGAVPFGTALLQLVAAQDQTLGAPDLAGLNPDMNALVAHIAAFRPYLEHRLRERWGIETLAVYVYPAQVTFCNKPFGSLADLAGRRIRSSNLAQSDLVEALGAVPVQTAFGDIGPKLRDGDIECAITGAMSGNTIGLHEVTTHVHTMAANWGLAVVGANVATWQALSPTLRATIRGGLRRLETAVWDDAERETSEGLLCNSGADGCVDGRKGRMVVVPATRADARRWREIVVSTVLPRWLKRCGSACETVWNDSLGAVTGIEATAPPR